MTMPTFVAVDVETTLNGNEEVGLAHPMHPKNRVVVFGIYGDKIRTTYNKEGFEFYVDILPADTVLCGHNISFDLMYLYKAVH